MKSIKEMTKCEFLQLPDLPEDYERIVCDSLVILPTSELHDSGWRCMYLIPIKDDRPLGKLGGFTDVIDFVAGACQPGWERGISIDCLPKSGLLRVFPWRSNDKLILNRCSLSTMHIMVGQIIGDRNEN